MTTTLDPTVEYLNSYEAVLPPYIDLTEHTNYDRSDFVSHFDVPIKTMTDAQLQSNRSAHYCFIRNQQVHMDAYAAAWSAFKNGKSPLQADLFASLHHSAAMLIQEYTRHISLLDQEIAGRKHPDPFADVDPGATAVPGTVDSGFHATPSAA